MYTGPRELTAHRDQRRVNASVMVNTCWDERDSDEAQEYIVVC